TAPDRKRHEDLFRDAADDIDHDLPAFMAGTDIQKDQLVRAVFLVAASDLHGVARVAQPQKVDSLYHPATINIHARHDSLRQHGPSNLSRLIRAIKRSTRHRPAFAKLPATPLYGVKSAGSTDIACALGTENASLLDFKIEGSWRSTGKGVNRAQ